MKRSFLLLLFCGLIGGLYGQVARFHADTTRLKLYIGGNPQKMEWVQGMEWIIDGQVLRFGSPPVEVTPDPEQLDTIFFRQRAGAKLDTIVCNVAEAEDYYFLYNTCCGAFDVKRTDRLLPLIGKVDLSLSALPEMGRQFMVTLGEVGMLAKPARRDTLSSSCRSAMSPNVYPLTFQEISPCNGDDLCPEGSCLIEKYGEEPVWDFGYYPMGMKLDMLYMPLGRPLRLVYDPVRDVLSIK